MPTYPRVQDQARTVDGTGTYARTVDAADAATAPHVQLGPHVRTKRPGSLSVMAIQNNDASAPDNGTRLYLVPRAATTTGVGAVFKIFGDDYTANQTDYRDLGIYFSQDQVTQAYPAGDTGTRGDGCFYINTKSAGTKAGLLPDLVFSMQDGTFVAARMALATVASVAKPIIVIGASKPEHGMKRTLVLEIQGDVGFDGAADRAIYWETTGGTSNNKLDFQRTASGGNLKLTLGGAVRAEFNGGALILGDQATAMAANSTVGFLHIRAIADTPSGTPTTYTGSTPLTYDVTNNKLWAYNGGWKSVTLS